MVLHELRKVGRFYTRGYLEHGVLVENPGRQIWIELYNSSRK
jgi:hypothetical protein